MTKDEVYEHIKDWIPVHIPWGHFGFFIAQLTEAGLHGYDWTYIDDFIPTPIADADWYIVTEPSKVADVDTGYMLSRITQPPNMPPMLFLFKDKSQAVLQKLMFTLD